MIPIRCPSHLAPHNPPRWGSGAAPECPATAAALCGGNAAGGRTGRGRCGAGDMAIFYQKSWENDGKIVGKGWEHDGIYVFAGTLMIYKCTE